MAYGSVKGARSVKATINYIESADPHNNKYVTHRNLNSWTRGIVGFDDEPLYQRMRNMIDAHPNSRRKFEAYNFIVSYSKDEFDVERDSEIEDMQDHVRETCDNHFGSNVPYSVHIQADGECGNLHAHITALNIDLNTGKSIRGFSNLYKWRHNMNEVTREREENNKNVEYPNKNAIVISANIARRKKQKGEQFQWHDELMDKIDNHFENTLTLTYDDFKKELAEEGITFLQDDKGDNTMSFQYAPVGGVTVNGKKRKSRRVKSSRLGTDYSSSGFKYRFEFRQQEILRIAEIERERCKREKIKKSKETVTDVESLKIFVNDEKEKQENERSEVEDFYKEIYRNQIRNQNQKKRIRKSDNGNDGLEF